MWRSLRCCSRGDSSSRCSRAVGRHLRSRTLRTAADDRDLASCSLPLHIFAMRARQMTYRVVSLHSDEARDARLGSTVEERLAMLRELSRMPSFVSVRACPVYSRAEMPVRLVRLLHPRNPRSG